ncbi:hypothetical protein PGT21_009217 [Puccinia graminis f. sp. tritici]|uniref:DUF1279 domain-containing protein n=1 Tax=Puccinia graminis f. sp. tritici TaxID=56615 RepID=A0A5B0RS12_PUCGR|nr:hypothetical protein PGT21_009217 [Puccinia graminis f. sp. tritici]KAA1128806.1 hypothetical protein PGTUg99_022149 [Puccinia graminis f. sp. tritici]
MVPAALFQKDSLNQKSYEYQHIHRDPSDSSRLRASKFSNPTSVLSSSSPSSVSANTSIDQHPKTLPSDYSLGNSFSKSTTAQDDLHQKGEKSPSFRTEEPPARVGLFGKIRQLTKLYGSAALIVYGLIGGVDFGFSFLMIYLIGAEHVRKAEDWVREQVHWKRAHDSLSTTSVPGGSEIDSDMLWTSAVVAYTIHKTILLPVRILLTAWITPPIVRHLRKRGWKIGRNLE